MERDECTAAVRASCGGTRKMVVGSAVTMDGSGERRREVLTRCRAKEGEGCVAAILVTPAVVMLRVGVCGANVLVQYGWLI